MLFAFCSGSRSLVRHACQMACSQGGREGCRLPVRLGQLIPTVGGQEFESSRPAGWPVAGMQEGRQQNGRAGCVAVEQIGLQQGGGTRGHSHTPHRAMAVPGGGQAAGTGGMQPGAQKSRKLQQGTRQIGRATGKSAGHPANRQGTRQTGSRHAPLRCSTVPWAAPLAPGSAARAVARPRCAAAQQQEGAGALK